MLKIITYLLTVLSSATTVTSLIQSKPAFADSSSSSSSSFSSTSSINGQPITIQQTSVSATPPNGLTVTSSMTTTTELDGSGKPVTKVIQSNVPPLTGVSFMLPGAISPPAMSQITISNIVPPVIVP
jgi:hypothetical protein